MELHISYCFYSKVSKKNNVWRNEKGFSGNQKKLCEMKQVQLIDGKVCVDHVHIIM